MLRNYLAAALRNLMRNRLYAAINIAGLAVGFAAALLIGIFVRDEFSYDTWIPGHEHTYLSGYDLMRPGIAPWRGDLTPPAWSHWLKLDFPQIQDVTRLNPETVSLRRGTIEANEQITWADPNFFSVIRLPAIAGNLAGALARPDGIVITRKIARKYFGRDDPIGELIEIDRQHPMRVSAVLADLPSNTHFNLEVIASGLASFSGITRLDTGGPSPLSVYTYFSLKPGARIGDIAKEMPAFFARHNPAGVAANAPMGITFGFPLHVLADIHLSAGNMGLMTPRGNLAAIYAVSGIGLLLVLVAAINFANLMIARANRRAVEIGVRKVSGAERRHLVAQFLGEALGYAVLALAASLVVAEVLLPHANAFLQRTMSLDIRRAPALAGAAVAFSLIVGALAGLYPTLVLSGFRPAAILKGKGGHDARSSVTRHLLVACQFAILIAIIVAAITANQQTNFAFNNSLRLNTDQVLLIATDCKTAFKDRVAALQGVQAAACASPQALGMRQFSTVIERSGIAPFQIPRAPIDFGFFDLYGIHPLAGRLFARDRAADAVHDPSAPFTAPLVVNVTAARQLGFSSLEDAVGATVSYMDTKGQMAPHEIIGVVPDFATDAVHQAIAPMVYFVNPAESKYMSVKVAGEKIPDTLAAIDKLWAETGEPRPIERFFFDQRIEELYRDISRQSQVFNVCSAVAVLVAALGLFGLAVFTAERQVKEIGIRKAMGASRTDIVRLVLWQFTKPVLWANIVAWPAGYVVMHRWLQGFAYHVTLSPWIFVAASGLALAIAVATVAGHALLVARSQPVAALRYE